MESYDEILLCSSQLQGEEQGKPIPEATRSREMSSLKAVKSLNDQDLLVLGRLDNQSGFFPLIQRSEYLFQTKRREERQSTSLQRASSVLFIDPMA